VFSNDGQHVYAVDYPSGLNTPAEPQLRHVDLSRRTISLIPLKKLSGDFRGVSRSDNQDILCATATALWRYHPADGTCTTVCDVPREPLSRGASDLTQTEDRDAAKDREFTDVAYDPRTRAVLLPTQVATETGVPINGLWLLKQGESKLQLVRIARLNEVECPVFDGNGELFFSNLGDLWHGKLADKTEDQLHPWLVAYRYAPLATFETDVGLSPAQCGVQSIAVARDFIYVFAKRLGGSGSWRLAQVPRPASKRVKESINEFNTHFDLAERLSVYRHVFDSAKVLTEETREPCHLCASADESRVYYTFSGKHWLITNGKLQELHLDRVEKTAP
jgi:hypothetical protein